MTRVATAAIVGLAVFAPLVACSGGDDAAPPTTAGNRCHSAVDATVTIVAKDLAWDTACLQVPAGQPVTIVVDNQDDGVAHDLHLKNAPGDPSTALETGPVRQELPVALAQGIYPYICDIHPNMEGAVQAI